MFTTTRLQEYYATPRKDRKPSERREAWREEYKELIRWWESYRSRNSQLNPDTYVLDKVGTINGVIRELNLKLTSF